MKNFTRALLFLPILILLTSCPYETKVPISEADNPVDTKLLGKWYKDGEVDKEYTREYNGPKRKGDWNLNIDYNNTSESWARATMMNAIYHFRTQASRHRIKQAGFFQNVKIRLKLRSGTSHVVKGALRHGYLTAGITRLFLRNDVTFYVTRGDDTSDIYSTMMHEMGQHEPHFQVTQ